MMSDNHSYCRRIQVYTARDLDRIGRLTGLSKKQRFDMKVVASVLAFRANNYVIDALIDWDQVPKDPIYQLTFPQRGMLAPDVFDQIATDKALSRADRCRISRQVDMLPRDAIHSLRRSVQEIAAELPARSFSIFFR